MRKNLGTTWSQVRRSTLARFPELSANEQTKATWAKIIASYAEVPLVFKDFIKYPLAETGAFPYTVLTPSYEGFLHRTTEKLICAHGREIDVLERRGETFTAQCYPIEDICYVEARTILLDARVKVCGLNRQGVLASSTLRFNAVTDYLFKPILERIRCPAPGLQGAVLGSELRKFDHWVRANYKFMCYARRSLLGGERVIHTILQPEIRARVSAILGRAYERTISPAHMCILTDQELILFREEGRQSGAGKYGGTWDYIPLNKIEKLSKRAQDDNLLGLSIQLPEGVCLECLYQADAERKIHQLMDQFVELV